jgi:hypothetical protein
MAKHKAAAPDQNYEKMRELFHAENGVLLARYPHEDDRNPGSMELWEVRGKSVVLQIVRSRQDSWSGIFCFAETKSISTWDATAEWLKSL